MIMEKQIKQLIENNKVADLVERYLSLKAITSVLKEEYNAIVLEVWQNHKNNFPFVIKHHRQKNEEEYKQYVSEQTQKYADENGFLNTPDKLWMIKCYEPESPTVKAFDKELSEVIARKYNNPEYLDGKSPHRITESTMFNIRWSILSLIRDVIGVPHPEYIHPTKEDELFENFISLVVQLHKLTPEKLLGENKLCR